PLGRKPGSAERGVSVHFSDQFLEIAEWELPDRVTQLPEWPRRQQLIAFVHEIAAVTHRAFAEQLRLAKIGKPTRASDPASHKVIAPRNEVGVMWRRG